MKGYPTITISPNLKAVSIGLLLGIGFVWPVVWWLYIPGFIWFLEIVRQERIWLRAVRIGWLVWWVKAALVISWLWSTYPLEWLPIGGSGTQLGFIALYWLTTALWVSVGGVLFAGVFWWLLRKINYVVVTVTIPFLWLLAELVGAVSFSLFFIGGNTSLSIAYGYGFIGYLLAAHEWLFQISAWWGIYSLSIAATIIPVSTWWWYQQPSFQYRYGLVAVISLLSLNMLPYPASYDRSAAGENKISVVALETNFSGNMQQTEEDNIRKKQLLTQAIEQLPLDDIDYIIFPEDARFITDQQISFLTLARYRNLFTSGTTKVIDSGPVTDVYGTALRGTILDTATMKVEQADKQFLVPQGEYMPRLYEVFFLLLGLRSELELVTKRLQYQPGPLKEQNFSASSPSILFCFASAHPNGVRSLLRQRDTRPPFIAHPISHAWFNSPTLLWQQTDTFLRVHARWNRIPIVSAGNSAPSTLYTPTGKVIRGTEVDVLLDTAEVRAYRFILSN